MFSVQVMGSGLAGLRQHRNQSALVAKLYSGDTSSTVVIDCGAKNLLYSRNIDFSKISRIYITHTHIDHVSNLGWVLRAIKRCSGSKLKLFYPPQIEYLLKLIVRISFFGKIPRFIEFLNEDEKTQLYFLSDKIKKIDTIQNTEVWVCKADHRSPTICYAFKNPNLKVVFPVDTLAGVPSIQKLARNSLIFFHECSAHNKNDKMVNGGKHSTPYSATTDALRSASKHLILTHICDPQFCQRSSIFSKITNREIVERVILKQAAEKLDFKAIPYQIKSSTKPKLKLKKHEKTILPARDLDTFIFKNDRLFLRRQSASFRTQYIQY